MEFYAFLITMGAILALAFIGIGVCIGDAYGRDKEQCERFDTDGILPDGRDGNRSGDNRPDIPNREEIERVLYNLRIGASQVERRVIDYLIDKESENEEEIY